MLRMEATVGGCCWSFEPPWARRVGAAASAPSRTMDTAEFFIGFSLSCGAGAQDLTLSRREKSSSSFTGRFDHPPIDRRPGQRGPVKLEDDFSRRESVRS